MDGDSQPKSTQGCTDVSAPSSKFDQLIFEVSRKWLRWSGDITYGTIECKQSLCTHVQENVALNLQSSESKCHLKSKLKSKGSSAF